MLYWWQSRSQLDNKVFKMTNKEIFDQIHSNKTKDLGVTPIPTTPSIKDLIEFFTFNTKLPLALDSWSNDH